jgi:hypothetical protein
MCQRNLPLCCLLTALPACRAVNGEYVATTCVDGDCSDVKFPTNYMDYPGGVESFDAYHGPITSTYGEVWWASWSNDLPKDLVDRFDGKAMAIVGVEMDQVRKTPHGDVSVPINFAYNHHHVSSIVGKRSKMVEMDKEEADAKGLRGHLLSGGQKVWAPVETEASATGLPSSALFDDGNGGEYRKTFHGYAAPFAQIVESPNKVGGTAMQIDTWNRAAMKLPEKPGDRPPRFVPGPHPRNSLAPTKGPDAIYSGLLECPLTTRVQVLPNNDSLDFGEGMAPFGQGSGYYNYTGNCTVPSSVPGLQGTNKCHQFGQIKANRCPEQPRGDLLAQRNPSCDIRTYRGGLATCLHGWRLLDADQETPWADQPLVYYKKFRVYFQEYNNTKHQEITRHDWGIGCGGGAVKPSLASGGAEYDVPQCAANHGQITTTCNHTITGTWMPINPDGSANNSPGGAKGQKVYLAAMHHHCHAPTCLRLDFYNNDTGKLLCRVEPVYGGTGGYVSDGNGTFDEAGCERASAPCCLRPALCCCVTPPLSDLCTAAVVASDRCCQSALHVRCQLQLRPRGAATHEWHDHPRRARDQRHVRSPR